MNKDQASSALRQVKDKNTRIWGVLVDDDFRKAGGSASKRSVSIQQHIGDATAQFEATRDELSLD